jgi:hypothetical protein
MGDFFQGTRPGIPVDYNGQVFELPALYFRDDCFMLFFSADFEAVQRLMPSDQVHPVRLPRGRAVVAVTAFNYIDTTIGPYGEISVAAAVVHGPKAPPPLVPLLLESRFKGFGLLVLHLPVTNQLARDGGRMGWNYPKFVADMRFTITPEYMEVDLSEDPRPILRMRVTRRGFIRKECQELSTYTVQGDRLIRTWIPHRGTYRASVWPRGSFMTLGDHPMAQTLKEMNLSARPIMSRYYLERWAVLPLGAGVAEGVRPWDGYRGEERNGRHEVRYLEG